MIRKRTYQAIYRLLDRVSPVPFDCGMICGAVCCGSPDELGRLPQDRPSGDDHRESTRNTEDDRDPELGIYLLPGEHKIFSKEDDWISWSSQRAEECDFPESWRGNVYFIRCKEPPHCPRAKRPIQCRTFPLLPHLTADEELVLIYNDHDLPYCCPLIEDAVELNADFMQATWTVWKHLIRDPLIDDLVRLESADRGTPEIVYPRF